MLAPLVGGVPVRDDPHDDGGEHPRPVLTTRTPGGYGLTIKEKCSSGHVTRLCVGEPCDPTIIGTSDAAAPVQQMITDNMLLALVIIVG
jgi:hypothetical protein